MTKKKQMDMYTNTTFLAGHGYKYMHHVVSDPKRRYPSGHAIKLPNFFAFRTTPSERIEIQCERFKSLETSSNPH